MNTTTQFMERYGKTLQKKINDLGVNWVLHPNYKRTEAHKHPASLTMEIVRYRAILGGRL